MAINVSALNSTLQTKIDALDAATDTKEILLLSKALDAAAGSTSVSDVLGEGVVQVNNVNDKGAEKVAEVNALATSTFKTVGGSSILGSGDIATLPSGGSAGQVVKKDASNNAVWEEDKGGKVLQIKHQAFNSRVSTTSNSWTDTGWTISITPTSTTSKILLTVMMQGMAQYKGIKMTSTNSTIHEPDSNHMSGNGSGDPYGYLCHTFSEAHAGSVATIEYRLYFASHTSGTFNLNDPSSSGCSMTVYEYED